MNKTYLILLSSLIACSSRGMETNDLKGSALLMSLKGSELWRYMSVDVDHFDKIYAVEQEIKKQVAGLRDTHQLTENAVLASIENALKAHGVDEDGELAFKQVYMDADKVVSADIKVGNNVYIRDDVASTDMGPKYRVRKFHENVAAMGSRFALLCGDYDTRDIIVYEEVSRGNWECIKNILGRNIKNIYLINNGKKLAKVDENDNVSFEDLDATNDNVNQESLIEEVRKKHAENYPVYIGGGVREWRVIDNESSQFNMNTNMPGKYIRIGGSGFRVDYTPTLQEIAVYLVRRAAQANM